MSAFGSKADVVSSERHVRTPTLDLDPHLPGVGPFSKRSDLHQVGS